jgi:hypothetical protein
MKPANFRRGVMAGGVVALSAVGAMIGARLKVNQEVKQVYCILTMSTGLVGY